MLARLGKWLRAAGYDTVIITKPLDDKEILKIATLENRRLLTCDRDFLKIKSSLIQVLKCNSLDLCAKALNINWLYKPFSRCMLCNTALKTKEEGLWYCEQCQKTYWLGSHTQHMLNQFNQWQKSNVDFS